MYLKANASLSRDRSAARQEISKQKSNGGIKQRYETNPSAIKEQSTSEEMKSSSPRKMDPVYQHVLDKSADKK